MVICARMPDSSELIVDRYKFEQVVGFTYLGTEIYKKNNLTEEVRGRKDSLLLFSIVKIGLQQFS
jgi:DNA modification methylase